MWKPNEVQRSPIFFSFRNTQHKVDTGIVRNAKLLRIESSNRLHKHYVRKADLFLRRKWRRATDGYVIYYVLIINLCLAHQFNAA